MDNFLTCLCDGDLTGLIINGKGELIELREAWVEVLEEFYDLKGDEPGAEWYLNRDIIRLHNQLFLLQICVDFLAVRYSEPIAASLCKLGYSFKPAVKEPPQYINLLQVIINRSRTKYVTLQGLIKQLEDRNKEIKEVKPPSRAYFENLLVHIEEMQGTSYDMGTITVNKFVTLEKKYWKQVDFLKEKNVR